MREPNEALRAARERMPSRLTPGEAMTRAELADAVNAWLWENTGRRFELDDHLIGKWERGIVHYPIRQYRAALRSLDDAELAGTIGGRYRELARHDRPHATRAAEYLGRALALRHPARVRLRAFDLVSPPG